MKISGFTFLRNAHTLYYPIRESILSILDLVDEFVIALGRGDAGDSSRDIIESINSPKIKIVDSEWDLETYKNGSIYAQQTDFAKAHCSGDWLFYLQGDELIHENDIEPIRTACAKYLDNGEIEGFLFNYKHFWGDYKHYFADHCWYRNEIRIIRKDKDIHSWKDAQSFRFIPDFKETDYHRTVNTRKLNVIKLNATVFHYGWVRPPKLMKVKSNQAEAYYNMNRNDAFEGFDYGRIDRATVFKGSHPVVMKNKIKELNWSSELRNSGLAAINRPLMKHERLKYRIINFVENKILNGITLGGFKNYNIVGKDK